ncbi:cytochrome P450 [Obelidium mucronatum]|nr:cytochrome P450 [Obelidium mucronatum]
MGSPSPLTLATSALVVWCVYETSPGDFPTMPGWPLLGNLLDLFDPTFPERLHKYESPVRIKAPIFPKDAIAFDEPAVIKAFMLQSPTVFAFSSLLIPKEAMVVSSGRFHRRLHMISGQALSKNSVNAHVAGVSALADRALEELCVASESGEVDPVPFLQKYAFDVDSFPEFRTWIVGLDVARLPAFLWGDAVAKALKAQVVIEQTCLDVVRLRKANNQLSSSDGLALFLKANAVEAESFSDEEVSVNIFGLMAGGFHTVSQTLGSIVHCLLHEVGQSDLDRVKADIQAANTDEEMASIESLNALIKESMRVFPMSHWIPRLALEDFILKGVVVPKGTILIPVRHRGHLRENAQEFQISRFMGADSYDKVSPLEFLPFGYGERSCPGMHVARLEMALLVGKLVGGKYVLHPGRDKTVFSFFPFHTARPSIRLERF